MQLSEAYACSEETDQLDLAMLKVQGEALIAKPVNTVDIPTKNGGKFTFNATDLQAVWACVRQALTTNGVLVTQDAVSIAPESVSIVTRLSHPASKQWRRSVLTMPVANDARAYGSGITYARRYALLTVAGAIADKEDDDGQGATAPRSGKAASPSRETPQKPPAGDPGAELASLFREWTGLPVGDDLHSARAQFRSKLQLPPPPANLNRDEAARAVTVIRGLMAQNVDFIQWIGQKAPPVPLGDEDVAALDQKLAAAPNNGAPPRKPK